ncbi:MAG: histidinol-phosphate aminotransferase family protein [Gammaproteobacteria bacterium]|nr:histidinol-phosphate aminotransferase family protein [Gammaproteobacteria bacterium]
MTLSRRDLLAASAALLAGPGALQRAAAREQPAGGPIVLCWNENPYGPSPAARVAVSESIAQGCRYPSDEELAALTGMLAAREGLSADHIVTGTGSGELLCALGLLYGRDGGEIIAAQPTYQELTHYAERAGAVLRWLPVDAQLRHDLPAMHAAVGARTRAVYVCNPNNPTGTVLPAAQIRDFVRSLPAPVVVIVDEAYMDFVATGASGSVADLAGSGARVVVLRTFSKIHGMAGLRCGYAIAPPQIAADLAGARMSTANLYAVRAARASLGDSQFLIACRQRILASRARITAELSRRKLRYAEPQGNFVFFDTGMPLERFSALMRERGILVGRLFPPFDTWCRITIGTEPEVTAFLGALQQIGAGA